MGEVVVTQKQFFKKNIKAYNGNVIDITYADLADLISEDGLNYRSVYKITDRGDNGLVFRAASPNRIESDGLRYMLCPATYAVGEDAYENDWIGVWNATKQATATEGQLTIWNGLVWTAGAVLSGDSPDTEASGWTVIPKASFTNHEYIEIIFGISYDFDNDWISKQWDNKGNVFGLDINSYYFSSFGVYMPQNVIDYCDWNQIDMYKNTCMFVFNNSCIPYSIYNNTNYGGIYNNSNKGSIYSNSNLGRIFNNSINGAIYINSNTDEIIENINSIAIVGNSNNGVINNNSISGQIYFNLNNGGININSQVSSAVNIQFNINNGSITGVWDADVTDAVVDKTGTAE